MRFPFGKFKGHDVRDVSAGYLAWALEECSNLSPALRWAIRRELAERLELQSVVSTPPPRTTTGTLSPADLDGRVRNWFHRLARQHHPDVGGDGQVMRAINEAHDTLRRELGLCA